MRCAHTIFFIELCRGYDVIHIFRQCLCYVVIDFFVRFSITIVSRCDKDRKDYQEYREDLDQLFRKRLRIRNKRSVSCLLKGLIENKDQGRQQSYAAYNSEDNTLSHYNTQVSSQCESHEAQCYKARYSSDGTSYNACKSFPDSKSHSFLVIVISRKLLVIAVPEEYRVVHCNCQLQDCRQCFCDIRDLSKEIV